MTIKPVIVIPIYRLPLQDKELISLRQLDRHLAKYDRIIIAPPAVPEPELRKLGGRILRFHQGFFTSTVSYSHLMLSEAFYRQMLAWSHTLIYQLDCLVFRDELMKWCQSPWDYIGSPWFEGFQPRVGKGGLWACGNGGLSLRNNKKFFRVLKNPARELKKTKEKCWGDIPKDLNEAELRRGDRACLGISNKICSAIGLGSTVEQQARNYRYNEDVFWSFEAMRFEKSFKVAPVEEALKFSFEGDPEWCLSQNEGRLPFGCHAWSKYGKVFWENILKENSA